MKVAVELRHIAAGASGGIALYLRELLETLFARFPGDEFHVFGTVWNRGLVRTEPPNVTFTTLAAYRFFEDLDQRCEAEGVDVLFRGFPVEDSLRFPRARQVVVVPDLQHDALPGLFTREVLRSRRLAFHTALAEAGALVTISEHARSTVLSHPWRRCPRVHVATPALRRGFLEEAAAAPAPRGDDYFLFPANLWRHKNHRRLLEAFRLFRERTGAPMRLVLAGHPDGWHELAPLARDLPVTHVGFVPEAELLGLLKGARALAFFSLFEGFGIPLLEAFAAGTPVVCSGTTSLPEVGGDAVLACDPTDVEAMSRLLERVATDAPLRETLRRKGRERLGLFSWERSADVVREALAAVARPGPAVGVGSSPPLVSIVTPSYNQGRFLRRTIESVLSQSYPHVEYVVRDGGSTDESVEVLRSYGDRLRWVSERDGGQSDAIRQGFAETRGDILAYLNSDDVLLPGALETVVRAFEARPAADLLYGNAQYIDPDDAVTGDYRTAPYSFVRLMQDCCICQPAAFWRRRVADLVGPFRLDLHLAMDYEYWLRIDRAGGRIEALEDVLASSRRYPETKTLSAREAVYREVFAVCLEHGGYVDASYFHGLWHHRLAERRDGWRRALPPRAYVLAAGLHHRAFHLRRKLPQLPGRLARGLGKKRRLGRVVGFFGDGWLGPRVEVLLPEGHGLRAGWLTGTAPQAGVVEVSCRGRTSRIELPGGTRSRIEVALEPGVRQTVRLRFSAPITDAVSRRLAFLLDGTNLFTEHDPAAPDRTTLARAAVRSLAG